MSGEDCQLLSKIWCEWWNSATGIAIPGSVFNSLPEGDPFLSGKPWSTTDDAAQATDDFLHFFF